MNLKHVRIGGKGYLGTLDVEGDGNAVLAKACRWADTNRATAKRYARKDNLGELLTITLMGAQSYTVEDLSPATVLKIEEELARMSLAREIATAKVTEAVYNGKL